MLIVDAIRKIVKTAILLKPVQLAHGMNVAAGLIYMSSEIVTSDVFISSRSIFLTTTGLTTRSY